MKDRERGFRRETIKGKSAWRQHDPINISKDPYIPDKTNIFLRQRRHVKEMPEKSGYEL